MRMNQAMSRYFSLVNKKAGPLLKVYIRDWLAGSAVALVLEERSRYSREWHAGSAVTVVLEERIREWLGGSPARQCMKTFLLSNA